jgi:hypothetical protein
VHGKAQGNRWRGVVRKAGLIGSLFFLLKGLAWLAAAGAVALGLL